MSPAYLPVSTYMVITSFPRSSCATMWETDLEHPLTKALAVEQILDGQYDQIARIMFADEQKGVFRDASAEIAEAIGRAIPDRASSGKKVSRCAMDFCEVHGVPVPAYLRNEVA